MGHNSYASDYDGYFPNHGGIPFDDTHSRYISPQIRMNKLHASGGGVIYGTDYIGIISHRARYHVDSRSGQR